MPRTPESIAAEQAITALADGHTSSVEIAAALGLQPRHVRKVLQRLSLPRLPARSPEGIRNASFAGGRRIDQHGYVSVRAPDGHPHARVLPGKNVGFLFEHRLVMEQKIGRYLTPAEVVDHIDGLTLHNHPDNLRLFPDNGSHLRHTLAKKVPSLTKAGRLNLQLRHRQPEALVPLDTRRLRKAAGVLRLRQILLAALQLGIDSPYLLGSSRHTTKAGIDLSSRSAIARALAELCQQWELPLIL